MPEPYLVPVLIAVEANDPDHATDLATRNLHTGFLGGDSERGAYEVPFAGSGRPVTYEQLADPSFSTCIAYDAEWLTPLDDPTAWINPRKEPSTDDG